MEKIDGNRPVGPVVLFVLFKSFDKECSNMFSGLFQKRRVQDIMIEFDIIDTKSERFIAT